jgi:UrcA family protein
MIARISLVAAIAASLVSTAAVAADYTFTVDRAELESRTGIERTMKRIERTARLACDVDTARDVGMRREARACAADVSSDIIQSIGHVSLTAAWNNSKVFAAR